MSVLYCVPLKGTRGSMVQDLRLVQHWILVSQNIGHVSGTQLIFAAWMISHPVQFSITAHLGKSTCPLYTSSSWR